MIQRPGAPPAEHLAIGQAIEFLVWTELIIQSRTDLHVFLPLHDRGIDGIVRRRSTDAMVPVQVKGRTSWAGKTSLALMVPRVELAAPDGKLVGVSLDLASRSLWPHAIVVDLAAILRLSREGHDRERSHSLCTLLPPKPTSRWAPWCVPLGRMGESICPPGPVPEVSAPRVSPLRGPAGRCGELEFIRRVGDCDRLSLFKAFPDAEADEYLVRTMDTGRIGGFQVKTASVPPGRHVAQYGLHALTMTASPRTWFALFVETDGGGVLADDCWVVPAAVVQPMVSRTGTTRLLRVPMAGDGPGPLDRFRIPRARLGQRIGEVIDGEPATRPTLPPEPARPGHYLASGRRPPWRTLA